MYIYFTTPKKFNPFSWLIRQIERREYSHVVLAWRSSELERKLVYQSNIHGMLFIGGEKFHQKNEVILEYKLTLDDFEEKVIKQWCVDVSGGSYAVSGILKSALNKLLVFMGASPIKFRSDGYKDTICSELVANALYPTFSMHINPDNLDLMTPSDLEKLLDLLCQKRPDKILKI